MSLWSSSPILWTVISRETRSTSAIYGGAGETGSAIISSKAIVYSISPSNTESRPFSHLGERASSVQEDGETEVLSSIHRFSHKDHSQRCQDGECGQK